MKVIKTITDTMLQKMREINKCQGKFISHLFLSDTTFLGGKAIFEDFRYKINPLVSEKHKPLYL